MARSGFRGRSGSTRTSIASPIGRWIGHVPDASETRRGPLATGALLSLRLVWWFRRETILVVGVAAAWQAALAVLPVRVAIGALVATVLAATVVERRTRACTTWLSAGVARRRFDRACRQAWAYDVNNRTPRVRRVGFTRVGYRLQITVPPGLPLGRLERRAADIASALRARALRIVPDPQRADRAVVTVVLRGPFAQGAEPSPLTTVAATSVRRPLPVGVDEDGDRVDVPIVGRSVVVAGASGAMASSTLAHLVAAAALDPGAVLWVLDLAGVALHPWRARADAIATTADQAIELGRQLLQVIDLRLQRAAPDADLVHVAAVDLGRLRASAAERSQLAMLVDDLVDRGPMVGVVPLVAVSTASVVVPTAVVGQFSVRWALRCGSSTESDAILGGPWARRGIDAATIDPTMRTTGWIAGDGASPVRVRAYELSEGDIAAVSARAVALRRGINRREDDAS